jgi:hypothetical protein
MRHYAQAGRTGSAKTEKIKVTTYTTNAIQKGIGNSAVSSQWFSRPDDQKFLTLDDMLTAKKIDAGAMTSRIVDTHKFEIVDDNHRDHQNTPTNWSFGQLSQLSGAPAGYLRDLPAPIAADCLQWGLRYNRGRELVKVYGSQNEGGELRAATGPDYGRIFDWEVLAPIKALVDESGGRWKVPGMMTGSRDGLAVYDPEVPVTLDTTTLFASDRDVFVFLVDDRHPIEVGKLSNGEPDLMFRGFYCWNSETGSKTAGIAAMYLRGVCMNRNLWGVEHFSEIKIRHTKFAPDRFAAEARPALESFAHGATGTFIEGVQAAKAAKIADDDSSRLEFLTKRAGLSGRMAKAAAARHMKEESRPVETVWDAAQAITAIARDVPHQDARIDIERKAGALLDQVAA